MTKDEYQKYLQSEHWKGVKQAFRKSKVKQICYVCETKKYLQIHHLTYVRLYREQRSDLIFLCDSCHKKAHEIVRENAGKNVTLYNAAKILRGTRLRMGLKKSNTVISKPRNYDCSIINAVQPRKLPPVIAPNGKALNRDHGYKIEGINIHRRPSCR